MLVSRAAMASPRNSYWIPVTRVTRSKNIRGSTKYFEGGLGPSIRGKVANKREEHPKGYEGCIDRLGLIARTSAALMPSVSGSTDGSAEVKNGFAEPATDVRKTRCASSS